MEFSEIIKNRRTKRKFEDKEISYSVLEDMVNDARVAPYPVNYQPLKFMIVQKKANNIFKYTKWAGLLKDGEPKEGERPNTFIAVLGDRSIKKSGDFFVEGAIACTTLVYSAENHGLSACWLGAIDREKIKCEIAPNTDFEVVYLVALGYSSQESNAVKLGESTSYYEKDGKIYVPKRSLGEVLIKEVDC